jgi:hypothetical protein
MTNQAGIWIDHRKAVIVTLATSGERIVTIESHVEKHPERTGDSPLKGAYEARQVPADDKRQRALTGELDRYYDKVIAALHGCAELLVFGPGEAKGEFRTRLERNKTAMRIVAVDTEDRMTDPQIAAKVRRHFAADGATR